MERDYATGEATDVKYFVGEEVEVTPAFNLTTLFVVGVLDPEEITAIATQHECDHVYFGANQSFDGDNIGDWERMISHVLRLGFWATLDLDVKYCQDSGSWLNYLNTYDHFITQISVKIPNLTKYNNNATIKIDDIDFRATNPGVWCHKLENLTGEEGFTDWNQYGNDKIIK
jgi:hypothetical protein